MPPKKLKTLPTKQVKENIRKKVRDEIKKKPKNLAVLKNASKPKKEYHKEFKRLMNIYSETSKIVNADTLANIKLAKEELLHHMSLKLDKSYTYAFIYIRQLAITLRKTIADTKKSSIYSVYNWQFLKNLELWTDFLVDNYSDNKLIHSLIHPLVQLIAGVIRLRPSARWLPIRFHCLTLLNSINRACQNVTPVLANIIEMFHSVNFNQKTKRDSKKTMNLMVMLHFSTSQLGTFEHLEQSLDQTFQLIVEHLAAHARSPTFPEYVVYLTSTIRTFTKQCHEAMFRKPYRSLVLRIEEHAQFVRKNRKPNQTMIATDAAFDQFVDNYRVARLNELETIMKATRHSTFLQPQDDYDDKAKNFDDETNNVDGDESSELDEDEFNNDEAMDDVDSAVEIDDE